ncbi:MAG: hypothetical protein IT181_20645, partial [Acidobacteria bacterium]|nr:hypothetical protein [Acidobacteriota bacterium]
MRTADAAADRGDWDTAVVHYREALGNAPGRTDLKIKLDRATRRAAGEHFRRAREFEAQEQLSGAQAEYRLAAELEPGNTEAAAKAAELDRRLRELAEANRPRPRVDVLRDESAQSGAIPRLDPRAVVPQMRFTNAAVRDLLRTISELTNINITYDQGLDAALSRPHSIDIQQTPLQDVLNQVLQASTLTFKVVNARTIFVYQDTPQKRQQFEDLYMQTFYLSSAEPAATVAALQQLLQGTQLPVPPRFSPNPAANTITVRATASVLQVIESFIKANDRPLPEVLIEAEILEVDRNYVRQLGLDLNQWALGFTFSPEVSPTGVAASFPPVSPPPFNVNTISQGVSASDFFATSPTALIRLLESNTNTKILARPSQRGTAGKPMAVTLGDQVPIPTTVFQSAAAGGVANVPTTSVQYTAVGVNLLFTPRVTYQDDIILDSLTLEKSGLGGSIDVGGQSFPTIVSRKATGAIRLRDGESTLIAGLLLDDDRRTIRSLPGLTNLPVLRSLFGNSDRRVDQTDIVMIITPRIVRGHNLTSDDVKPMYVGTGQNIGTESGPTLISPEALNVPAGGTPAGMSVAGGPGAQTPAGVGPGPGVTTAMSPSAARDTEVMPIQPTSSAARPPAGRARIVVSPPNSTAADGALAVGGGPYSIPIQISDASGIASVSLTITYDPAIVRMPAVTQGSFLTQGGVAPTVTP